MNTREIHSVIKQKFMQRSAGIILGVFLLAGAQPASAIWSGASSGSTYVSGGDKDYDNTGNWVGGTIDESFAGFTLTGDLTVYLDLPRTSSANPLNFNYSGAFNMTLANSSSSGTRGFDMNGNLSFNPTTAGRTLSFDRIALNFNGADRTFDIGTGNTFSYSGAAFANGSGRTLIKDGGGLMIHGAGSGNLSSLRVDEGEFEFGTFDRIGGGTTTIMDNGTLNVGAHYNSTVQALVMEGGTLKGTGSASANGPFAVSGITSTGGGTITFTGPGYFRLGGNVAYNAGGVQKALVFNSTVVDLGAGTRVFTVADEGTQAFDVDMQSLVQNGGITKLGAGTMRISNAGNTYNGATTVTAGTLLIDAGGSIASSASTVNGGTLTVNGTAGTVALSSGTLKGSGSVGALTITGGTLAPGNSVEQLGAGNTSWNTFDYQWEINDVDAGVGGSTGWDHLNITGTLDVGAGINVLVTSLTLAQANGLVHDFDMTADYVWKIATASAGVNNFSVSDFTLNLSGFQNAHSGASFWSITKTGNDINVVYDGQTLALIPEPTMVLLLVSGGMMLWFGRRRAKRTEISAVAAP